MAPQHQYFCTAELSGVRKRVNFTLRASCGTVFVIGPACLFVAGWVAGWVCVCVYVGSTSSSSSSSGGGGGRFIERITQTPLMRYLSRCAANMRVFDADMRLSMLSVGSRATTIQTTGPVVKVMGARGAQPLLRFEPHAIVWAPDWIYKVLFYYFIASYNHFNHWRLCGIVERISTTKTPDWLFHSV